MTIRKSRLARSGLGLTLALAVPACGARDGAGRTREFAGPRAFGYLEQQMQFGPRIPGTVGHERTGDWILQHLRATADSVVVQSITHVTRQGATLHLRNFFARFRPQAADRVLFLAPGTGRRRWAGLRAWSAWGLVSQWARNSTRSAACGRKRAKKLRRCSVAPCRVTWVM
ncbi:MAG TPA: hypothetical protein VK531_14005, partial [Gemmatimonadales bacterium]|nr:hypothetical protein [Gemmatimonadales bacterium]